MVVDLGLCFYLIFALGWRCQILISLLLGEVILLLELRPDETIHLFVFLVSWGPPPPLFELLPDKIAIVALSDIVSGSVLGIHFNLSSCQLMQLTSLLDVFVVVLQFDIEICPVYGRPSDLLTIEDWV